MQEFVWFEKKNKQQQKIDVIVYEIIYTLCLRSEYGVALLLLLNVFYYLLSLISYVWKYTFGGPVDLTDEQRVLLGVRQNGKGSSVCGSVLFGRSLGTLSHNHTCSDTRTNTVILQHTYMIQILTCIFKDCKLKLEQSENLMIC
jgi:hypothetical protein